MNRDLRYLERASCVPKLEFLLGHFVENVLFYCLFGKVDTPIEEETHQL